MQIYNSIINKIGVLYGKDYLCTIKPIKRMIMNKWTLLVAAATFALGATAQQPDEFKEKVIDQVKYRVTYRMSVTTDTTRTPQIWRKHMMLLDIGDHLSKFYDYNTWQADSARQANPNDEAYLEYLEGRKSSIRHCNWELYKNYPGEGLFTTKELLGLNHFYVEEKADVPEWSLQSDSIREIMGYTCHLASAFYKGRLWSAWYAEDIPIDDGPWKLRGLPGLILRAEDSQRHYVIYALGLKQVDGSETIRYKSGDFNAGEKVSMKQLAELRKRYYADMAGFINNTNPNVKVIISGNTRQSKVTPFNPIER